MKAAELAFKTFHAAGIKQVFGSGMHTGPEGTPPGDQSMQFVFYVKWGMTPAEALQTATVNAAAHLNNDWDLKVGTVERGSSPISSPSPATRCRTSARCCASSS